VGVRLLGEQRQHVHRLGELRWGDAGDPAVVGDADDVQRLAVAGQHAVAELGDQTLHPPLAEVDLPREPGLELDVATLLLAALDDPFETGPVRGHTPVWGVNEYEAFHGSHPGESREFSGVGRLRRCEELSGVTTDDEPAYVETQPLFSFDVSDSM